MWTQESSIQADKNDVLASAKDLFHIPQGVIYLDGNSLGVMPKAAVARTQEVLHQEWSENLILSWNTAGWFDLPARLGNKLAKLIGAGDDEVVVTDTTSLNVFKVLAAAIHIARQKDPSRKVIVSERETFPTDLYMIQGLTDFINDGYSLRLVDEHLSLDEALTDDVAIVLLSQVNYRSGYLHDMTATNALAHKRGVLTIWDLCHSAGAVEIDLTASNADFAVGCTYKYLNGGPGSPAFIWVAQRHQDAFWQPLSGWWGHAKPFQMHPQYTPSLGIRRFLCGTQPIISMALVECGLDAHMSVNMAAIRAKSLALTDMFIELVNERCAQHGLKLITPLDHAYRGSHVSFEHPDGFAIVQALIARGIIGDYREPSVMRFGITPLYIGFEDIWNTVEILTEILDNHTWDQPLFKTRAAVT